MSSDQTGLDFGVALGRIRMVVDLLQLSAMQSGYMQPGWYPVGTRCRCKDLSTVPKPLV